MSSIFDSIETHIEEVCLALPITPDWVMDEFSFTVEHSTYLDDGGELLMFVGIFSRSKIHAFSLRSNEGWVLNIYTDGILRKSEYVSTRGEFTDIMVQYNCYEK